MNEASPKPPSLKRGNAPRWIVMALGIVAVAAIAWYAPARRSAPVSPPVAVTAPGTATPAPEPGIRGVTDDEIKLGMVASFSGSNKVMDGKGTFHVLELE